MLGSPGMAGQCMVYGTCMEITNNVFMPCACQSEAIALHRGRPATLACRARSASSTSFLL